MVQAEIDAAAELIDFFRFNAKHAIELEKQQPIDADGSTNTMLYRGLEVSAPHRLLIIDYYLLHCLLKTLTCVLRVLLPLWLLLTSLQLVETWRGLRL